MFPRPTIVSFHVVSIQHDVRMQQRMERKPLSSGRGKSVALYAGFPSADMRSTT